MTNIGYMSEWDRAKQAGYAKVMEKFGVLPRNCADLDLKIKEIANEVISEIKKFPLPTLQQRAYLEALENKKFGWEAEWVSRDCRNVIENIRAQSSAIVLTDSAIKAEKSVLGKGSKNENLYIGIGGLIMLVGLYIVLK